MSEVMSHLMSFTLDLWMRFARIVRRKAVIPVGRLSWGPDWWTFQFYDKVKVIAVDPPGKAISLPEPLVPQLTYWHPSPPRRIFEIADALFLPRDGVIMLNQCLVRESYAMPDVPVQARFIPSLLRAPHLQGSFIPVNRSTYYHFVLEELTSALRLHAIDPSTRPALPAKAPEYQFEALELSGLMPEHVNVPSYLESCLVLERGNESGWPRADDVARLRKALLPVPQRADASNRIYVSRSRSSRSFWDEITLQNQLAGLGFNSVYCEAMSFSQQIRMFARSSVVVGMHGAGLTNAVFMPEGSLVIELVDRNHFNPCFQVLSNILGHRHVVIDCRSLEALQIIQHIDGAL